VTRLASDASRSEVHEIRREPESKKETFS